MGIIIDDIQDTLLLDISSLEGTVNVFSKPNVYSLKVSPDVIVPKATNTTYGVIKGSDSILINNGTPVINPDYLQGYLSLSLGPYFDDYSSESILPYVDSKISDFISTIDESYLSKIKADTAKAPITFQDTAKIDKELIFGDYDPGMIGGNGGRIDVEGNAELESLVIRSFLEVPELRHNRETIMGMEMTIGDSGIILKVTPTADPDMFILTMKLEEGELISFWEHDIVKGIFNHGNGFFTSWFRINSIDQAAKTMLITMASPEVLSSGRNFPPKPFMHIAHRGNFIHTERQTVIFLTAYEKKIIILSNVDNYEGGLIVAQLGVPTGLENVLGTIPVDINQPYLFAKGILVQDIIRVNYLGQILKEIIDRGIWSLETAQNEPYVFNDIRQDLVWVGWSRYLCIVNETLLEPSEGATDWVMDLDIEDAFDESVTNIYEGLDDLAGQINAAESNLGDLTGALNTLRDETLVAMEDSYISEAERRSLYAIYVRLDIEQEQLLSDVMYAINSIYMPPIYKDKLQSISDKFLSAGGSLDQYQASIDAILNHADPHITEYEREEYNRTLLIYSRDHEKLVSALRDSRLAIDAEIKRLANQKTDEVEGGKNLIRNYDQRWDFDFWGGEGISVDIDLDAITIVNQRGLIDDGNLIEDESGNIIELV